MNLYKMEWQISSLYVGAHTIPEAIEAAKQRGYTGEPVRVLTVDTDLVLPAPAQEQP